MQLIALQAVRHSVQVGHPLPFNVRLSDQTLLLARGQVVADDDQLAALFDRGVLVDVAELLSPAAQVRVAPATALPALWESSIARATAALREPAASGFDAVLDDVAEPLVALVEREPDLAIFQVLRQHGSRHAQYGVNHAIHCAIAAFLAASRLGWDAAGLQRAFKAALTMNVSMLELQGELATQVGPLTDAQRAAIHSHPSRSVAMLRDGGVSDEAWLEAVADHHETADGGGYPAGHRHSGPLAALLQCCDIYTAKLSPRRSRESLAADVAARGLFQGARSNPQARDASAALIKEFGLYPPGCFVRLASGETAVVVRRGAQAHAPQVMLLGARTGATRRDTSVPAHAIVGALNPGGAAALERGLPDGLLAAAYGG